MANQDNIEDKVLTDYAMPSINEATISIQRSIIQVAHFDIKPAIIQMVENTIQFNGLSYEDPNSHITNFLKTCNTFKHIGVTNDAICMKLFPFLLKDKYKIWLNFLATGTITT